MPTFEVLLFAEDNSLIAEHLEAIKEALGGATILDTPSSFCKYAFLKPEDIGFHGRANVAEITDRNRHQLISEYTTRDNEIVEELPYLHRYFPKEKVDASTCKCIAVVLYDREQLCKEEIFINENYGIVTAQAEPTWGISPMTPTTIVRNAIGMGYGGNGNPINRDYYAEAVGFWSKWAIVK